MAIALVDLEGLESLFAQMERRGVSYGYGAKAPSLRCDPSLIKSIDCSGWVRYALAQATDGKLILPDGSQSQRAWCEDQLALGLLHKVEKYSDVATYLNAVRLFVCFIRPGYHGCGAVGHVWLVAQFDDGNNGTRAGTLESHGGAGIDSRAWNNLTLVREWYSAYELRTIQGVKRT